MGNMIREIHTNRILLSKDRNVREAILADLFCADRRDHLYNDVNGILGKLSEGYCVISTRYFLSSLAYHVFKDEDYESVYSKNKDFLLPDYTLFLDCPIEQSLKRIASARLPDINEEKSNLERVAKNYQRAIEDYRKRGAISVINASREPAAIGAEIIALLRNKGIIA
jgi:dTMP kinase